MMDNELKDILEGFNAGYIMRQKRPDTYQQLEKAIEDVDMPFFQSFLEGGKEYEMERIKELMTKDTNINTPSKDINDKDHIEPDMDA